MLSDRNRTLLLCLFSVALLCRFSGGSRCFEERPCASGNTSILSPFVRRRAGIGICSRALLFLCHLLIYKHSCLSVSVSIRVFCVDGPCPCVPLLIRNRASLSFSFPFYHLLFGSRPRWSRLISPRTCVTT